MAKAHYIKIKGLTGEVALKNFKDCFRVQDISMSNMDGGGNSINSYTGIGQKYERVHIAQYSDYVYPEIYGFQDPKTEVKEVFGYVATTEDNDAPIIEQYHWKNCRFHDVRKDTMSGFVSYSFTYTWLQITFKSHDGNGKFLSQKVKTHDVAAGTYS